MRFAAVFLVLCTILLLAMSPANAASKGMKKYIVVFKDSAFKDAVEGVVKKIEESGGKVLDRFTIMPAISVELPAATRMRTFETMPEIDYVEEDQPVQAYNSNP
ncbi:hypothetical protein HK104_004484 [Borealophlyctis nickersoniae]|nr:hypothetical protein HK104_004484 [Borealophlyctis nickersoniae]